MDNSTTLAPASAPAVASASAAAPEKQPSTPARRSCCRPGSTAAPGSVCC
jgi:hypothetical protein